MGNATLQELRAVGGALLSTSRPGFKSDMCDQGHHSIPTTTIGGVLCGEREGIKNAQIQPLTRDQSMQTLAVTYL